MISFATPAAPVAPTTEEPASLQVCEDMSGVAGKFGILAGILVIVALAGLIAISKGGMLDTRMIVVFSMTFVITMIIISLGMSVICNIG